ncbi:delta(14)-sterol reductase TM7SF2-like [Sycon ciliatum]|uniref:delta(14)-sterol reductase TM7SF2-like n=1 Tax=Sycon ciliatum TaxID=27933 RepID=UPI0031F6ECF8
MASGARSSMAGAHPVGTKVLALWPGSGLYYPGTVVRQHSGARYDVEFEDSSTFLLPANNLMLPNSRRGGRSPSRSRSRSPSRRRRSRSRSPARRTGKSPTRAGKSPKRPVASASTLSSENDTVDSLVESSPVLDRRTPRRSTRGRPAVDESVEQKNSTSLSFSQTRTGGAVSDSVQTVTSPALSPALSTADSGSAAMGSDAPSTTTTDGGASSQAAGTELNKKTTNFEFGGPMGALFTMISLPLVIMALYGVCNPSTCSVADLGMAKIPALWSLFSWKALMIVDVWLAFHAFLYCLDIGWVQWGQPLRDGSKLPYRISALQTFVITCVVFLGSVFYGDRVHLRINPVYVYENYLQLAFAATMVSLVLSIFLYAYSFRQGAMCAEGGNTGNMVYDFFIGRELNPRIGRMFDLKVFCELRPGLIAWVAINFCMAYTQYVNHGYVSNAMLLVNAFQFLYVLDGLASESAILTTMDIISDGFGFMLAFGDLAWVPFIYTLQARYLVDRPEQLPTWAVAYLVGLNMLGFYIFRSANSQKDEFRRAPNSTAVSHLYRIPTSRGRSLLADGWWGVCRKPNYLGDLMMALAWCGTCGVQNIICYFYFIYFAILLIHRQRRDDLHCARKYGEAWKEYTQRVPYRIVPGIY